VLPISWCFNKEYIMAQGDGNIKIEVRNNSRIHVYLTSFSILIALTARRIVSGAMFALSVFLFTILA
jgi:hypothetical protein